MSTILIVDDEPDVRRLLKRLLDRHGYDSIEAGNAERCIALIRTEPIDIVLLDFRMPGASGIEALKQIKEIKPQLPVILVTGMDEAELAIDAIRHGAHDYLTKPVDEKVLGKVIEDALDSIRLMQTPIEFEGKEISSPPKERIVGRSPVMWNLYKEIGRVAASDVTVLITGETGTGKELVARAVYKHSQRLDRKFLAINCSALPDSLLESEFFGHEKGAFTSAHERHIGKFERAHRGTIFLDEIGEMTSQLQAKLLRIIQEKTFERVGGEQTLSTDVRIIAATNQNLMNNVQEGRFREDLYYRLNVFHLHLPPLRERREDIPELSSHFLSQIAAEMDRPFSVLSVEALDFILNYDWPGNVRELRNVLVRAALAAPTQVILPKHIHFQGPRQQEMSSTLCPFRLTDLDTYEEGIYNRVISEVESRLIQYALDRTGGNLVHTCKLLGISRTMLRSRLKEFKD